MPRRISEETKQLMQELDDEVLSVAEIARRADVPYSTAYGYIKVKQKINPETKQPFKSLSEYQNCLVKQKTNPETKQPFGSYAEYRNYSVKQKINPETEQLFKSYAEYQNYSVKQKINPETEQLFKSYAEYQNYLVKQKINPETEQLFESLSEYGNYSAKQRQERQENQILSDLIRRRLKELGKSQRWLAEQLEITEGAVSRYLSGKTTPRKNFQGRLFEALEVPYQTLGDLLKDH